MHADDPNHSSRAERHSDHRKRLKYGVFLAPLTPQSSSCSSRARLSEAIGGLESVECLQQCCFSDRFLKFVHRQMRNLCLINFGSKHRSICSKEYRKLRESKLESPYYY